MRNNNIQNINKGKITYSRSHIHHIRNGKKYTLISQNHVRSRQKGYFNLVVPAGSATVEEMTLLVLSENAQHEIEEHVMA